MLAFYATDTGKAMVAKTPAVMQATNEAMQSRMIALMPKVKALNEEFIARVKASEAVCIHY